MGRRVEWFRGGRRLLPYVGIGLIGLAIAVFQTTGPVRWTADGLFYESTSERLMGKEQDEALRTVFYGPLGERQRYEAGSTPGFARTTDWRWITYSQKFYERRLLVPTIGAGLKPLFADRSLLTASLVGYLLAGVFLLALLRRLFPPLEAFIFSTCVLLLEPVREWSFHPLTDSWGLALTAVVLLAGWLVLERGRRWLPAWTLALFLLALTRESALVFLAAAAGGFVIHRTRTTLAMLGTAVMAVTPLLLLRGASLKDVLAYGFAGNRVPREGDWSFVISEYWPNLRSMLQNDMPSFIAVSNLPIIVAFTIVVALLPLRQRDAWKDQSLARLLLVVAAMFCVGTLLAQVLGFALLNQHFPYGLVVVVGLAALSRRAVERAPGLTFVRCGAAAAVALILLFPQARDFRAELVLIPFALVGLGRVIERRDFAARRLPRTTLA